MSVGVSAVVEAMRMTRKPSKVVLFMAWRRIPVVSSSLVNALSLYMASSQSCSSVRVEEIEVRFEKRSRIAFWRA